MTAKEYIESVAQELGKLRGRGLLLSPADAQLALRWHAGGVPLEDVLGHIRRATRLKSKAGGMRGTAEVGVTLQALEDSIRIPRKAQAPKPRGLSAELRAAVAKGLAAREAWQELAERAEELIADRSGEAYWTEALRALKQSLKQLPRRSVLQAGALLRSRLSPRPRAMPRRRYQRSLQLLLLSAASEGLGVPPRAFLL